MAPSSLQAPERRIERAFLHLQHFIGAEMDGLRDGVSVHRAALEGVQDQQIERALQERRLSGFTHIL